MALEPFLGLVNTLRFQVIDLSTPPPPHLRDSINPRPTGALQVYAGEAEATRLEMMRE